MILNACWSEKMFEYLELQIAIIKNFEVVVMSKVHIIKYSFENITKLK